MTTLPTVVKSEWPMTDSDHSTGKTILASIIIDRCLGEKLSSTAYFYCKDSDPQKDNCISVYRGLLTQLLPRYRDLLPYCYDKIRTSGEMNLMTTSLAEQLLSLFAEKIPKQYIVVDGLDECDHAQRKLVLTFLTSLVDRCDERDPGKLRVLFVSQDFPDIDKALKTATIVQLTGEDNEKDIKAYVDGWCLKVQQKHELEAREVDFIKESTCVRAKGVSLSFTVVRS